jgi:hypothetical protein
MNLVLLFGLILAVAACATTAVPDPTVRPVPAATHVRPVVTPARPAVAAPAYPAARTATPRTTAPRTTASYVPAARPVTVAPAPGGYVRLRGSPEIHVRTCPKVARANAAGIVPASGNDGPPCSLCRKAEAISRMR